MKLYKNFGKKEKEMKKEKIQGIIDTVKQQELDLRFDSFSNDDAFELGKHFVQKIKDDGIEMAVQIKKVNGNTLFSYFSDGTNLMNENWMKRKFKTVLMNERSSYLMWAFNEMGGRGQDLIKDVEILGIDPKEYALCGGGFPVKLKTGEMVAVILASNLPHEKDHKFIVEGLESYLKNLG